MTVTETSTETELPAPLQTTIVPTIGSIIGPTGPQGAQGAQGTVGSQGPQGYQGQIGPQGSENGPPGPTGPQGIAGPTGPQGVQGSGGVGPVGPQGIAGPTGPQGVQGTQGAIGGMGNQGVQGTQGFQGPQGFQGQLGNTGANGPQGPQGSQGMQGPTGSLAGTAGGDLSGSYPNPTVVAIQGHAVASSGFASSGQVYAWSGSQLVPSSIVNNITAGAGISVAGTGAGGTGAVTLSVTGAPPTGPAGGCLMGTYPNPDVWQLHDFSTGSPGPRPINGSPRVVSNALVWALDPDLSNNYSWNSQPVVNNITLTGGLTGTASANPGAGAVTIAVALTNSKTQTTSDVAIAAGTATGILSIGGLVPGHTYLITTTVTFSTSAAATVSAWLTDGANISSNYGSSTNTGGIEWASITVSAVYTMQANSTAIYCYVYSTAAATAHYTTQSGATGAVSMSIVEIA